jgi:hypothetical protein
MWKEYSKLKILQKAVRGGKINKSHLKKVSRHFFNNYPN